MKLKLFFIMIIAYLPGLSGFGQEQTPIDTALVTTNTVRKDVVFVAGITDVSQLTQDKMHTQLSYLDGLGRAVQRVNVAGSPAGKNIVQPLVYDKYGQQPINYLPFASANDKPTYQANVIAAQRLFYQTTGDAVANDDYPFSVVKYDDSPLGRITESGAPGADWQPGGHTVKNIFRLNAAVENIRIWTSAGPSSSVYAEGQLAVNEVTDENGNRIVQYRNKLGQIVLKKVQADASSFLETVYMYDDAGNLIYQLSPEGVRRIYNGTASWNTAFLDVWATVYNYDADNRLVEKKAPSAKPIYMVYDKLDRLILFQDGKMRTENKWCFTKYDMINRPVLEGIYLDVKTRQLLQEERDNNISDPNFESKLPATEHGYSNNAFPKSNITVFSVNYYDDYDFDGNGADDYSYLDPGLADAATSNYKNTKGMLTGTKKRVIGSSEWLKNIMFYDEYGNTIQTRSNNQLNAAVEDVTSNVYDIFAGRVTKIKKVKKTNGNVIAVVNKFDYDLGGNITKINVNHNGTIDQVIAKYEYNELGQLVRKKLHCSDSGENLAKDISLDAGNSISSGATLNVKATSSITLKPGFTALSGSNFTASIAAGQNLQSVDYRYNIRGWLTNINNSKLIVNAETNADGNDVFGMELIYNQKDIGLNNNQYYNGKIAAVKWKTKVGSPVTGNPERERSYKFTYDSVDRLTKAEYAAFEGTGWAAELGGYNEQVDEYDQNGNVLKMKRNTWNSGASVYNTIDDLQYEYKNGGSNQIDKVTDKSGSVKGFNDGFNGVEEYQYDDAGNLKADANKGITITYNELNKTSRVDFSGGKHITYTYDASGVRIRKEVFNTSSGAAVNTYDYIDGFVYENSNLSFYPTAEGRVRTAGSSAKFEYFITDHLGNVRVSFEEQNGIATVVQENDYYPFGMTMKGIVEQLATKTSGANKQLYNAGSELQDDFLDEQSYSTFYREYDPVLGRFNAIDPMVDKYASWSPYNFALNDPVGLNDPLGNDPDKLRDGMGNNSNNNSEFLWRNGVNGYPSVLSQFSPAVQAMINQCLLIAANSGSQSTHFEWVNGEWSYGQSIIAGQDASYIYIQTGRYYTVPTVNNGPAIVDPVTGSFTVSIVEKPKIQESASQGADPSGLKDLIAIAAGESAGNRLAARAITSTILNRLDAAGSDLNDQNWMAASIHSKGLGGTVKGNYQILRHPNQYEYKMVMGMTMSKIRGSSLPYIVGALQAYDNRATMDYSNGAISWSATPLTPQARARDSNFQRVNAGIFTITIVAGNSTFFGFK